MSEIIRVVFSKALCLFGSILCIGGQDAMIPDEVDPQRWDQRRKFLDQLR